MRPGPAIVMLYGRYEENSSERLGVVSHPLRRRENSAIHGQSVAGNVGGAGGAEP